MKNHFFKIAVFTVLTVGCKEDKKLTGIYEFKGENIQATIIDDDDSLLTGFGASLYDNGAVRSLAMYKDGVPLDTIYYYHKNGQVQEKGIIENDIRKGWWTYYNEDGRTIKRFEWVIARDSAYKNQSLYFNNRGELKEELSTYFELDIPDTIIVGRNIAKVKDYSRNFNNDKTLLTVIVYNQYSENEIRKDTFSDGTMLPFFGVYGNKPGKQLIKGELIETILSYNADSTTIKMLDHYKYFEKDIYVWEEKSYSTSGLRIARQMEEDYKEN